MVYENGYNAEDYFKGIYERYCEDPQVFFNFLKIFNIYVHRSDWPNSYSELCDLFEKYLNASLDFVYLKGWYYAQDKNIIWPFEYENFKRDLYVFSKTILPIMEDSLHKNQAIEFRRPELDIPLTFSKSIAYDSQNSVMSKVNLPQFTSTDNDPYAKINDFYKKLYEKYLDDAISFLEDFNADTKNNLSYALDINHYIVTLINEHHLQINVNKSYYGFARLTNVLTIHNWNLKNGSLLTLNDVFNVSSDIYLPRIKENMEKWINENSDSNNININELLANLNNFEFTNNGGLVFYFPERIVDYMNSKIRFYIPLSEISDILASDYKDIIFTDYKNFINYSIYEKLKSAIKDFKDLKDETFNYKNNENLIYYDYYKGKTSNLPNDLERCIVIVTECKNTDEIRIYLFAADSIYNNMVLLSCFKTDLNLNTAKMGITFKDDNIMIWSQLPNRNTTIDAVLNWDGKNLNLISVKYEDILQEIFDMQRKMIDANDIDGLMSTDVLALYPYAHFYDDYLIQPKPVLTFAYKKALEEYKNSNISKAIEILKYGLNYYTKHHFGYDFSDDIVITDSYFNNNNEYLLIKDKFMEIINDYAFFLYKNGNLQESEKFLLNIVNLCPECTVVYINLGDLYWDKNEKQKSIVYYKKYSQLLKGSKVPDYIQKRISAIK